MSKEHISYEQFMAMDIRFGKILSVEIVPETDKLLLCKVDVGEEEPRTIVSGIREYFEDEQELVGKTVQYILNIEPRRIKGILSEGMLMATGGKEEKPFRFIIPDGDVEPGASVV
jgi:methionyl-tRNA synthetase